jgi:predicted phosphodiesterase
MKLVWLTDLHFNFVSIHRIEDFLAELEALNASALLMTGDLGEAETVVSFLKQFESGVSCPLYFVLGNHDFYGGSIQEVRRAVSHASTNSTKLNFLTSATAPIALNSWLGLIGHDGYGDARAGNFLTSGIRMNDYELIEELKPLQGVELQRKLNSLGDEAAEHIGSQLELALAGFQHVLLLSHVPPFQEATWYQGQMSDKDWAPHFTCQAMGEQIVEIMAAHPTQQLTVLCGHTHNRGNYWPLPNVQVRSGGSEYTQPTWTDVWEVAE